MNKIQIFIVSILGLGLVTACTNDADNIASGKIAIVKASIGESSIEQSKSLRATAGNDDNISYTSFADNDIIGLFATGGLSATNTELTLSNGSFKSDNLQWTSGNAQGVYAYFPYSASTDVVDIWREESTSEGKKWKAGFEDMLAASNNNIPEGSIINLGFTHQFAMLVIKRGTGFSKATQKEATVTLNQSVAETAKIEYSNGVGSVVLQAGINTANELPTNAGSLDGKDVDYVIIPIGKINGTDINVASITLFNDLDRKMSIAHSIKGGPQKNNKYIVTVEMRDNQAVVSPVEIVRWDDESVEITEPAGISTEEAFRNWAADYNSIPQINTHFGDYGSLENGKWTFRLLNDIDLTGKDFNGITNFSDIFDGQGYTITGINIKEVSGGSNPTGFTRTLSGTIKRLILKDAVVYGENGVGAFAGKAETGAILEKCQVTGASIIFGTNHVDAFIGNNAGGIVTSGCSQSSTVIVKQQ